MSESLAQKLDRLFKTIRREDGREYTYRDIAAEIERRCQIKVSPSYVWQLRTGQRDNPTIRHIEALATVFGISPQYFLDDAEAAQTAEELALLAALRDSAVRQLALRAQGLSHESLAPVRELVERVRELERLDERRHQRRHDEPDAAVERNGEGHPLHDDDLPA
ncbi:MAG TPA: helix-turn-helix transcriptional regulator [Ktedonobacterales bacterium]|nr:helix-turn-helix transcriptional regulator [Ktedonobacterales bacterium]